MTFEWSITEDIPFDLGERPEGATIYRVESNAFDVAIGDLPFLLAISDDSPYERVGAPWQKDQFDNMSHVGEQSLTGWWLRSQVTFNGGAGITYFEPLHAERELAPADRCRDSRGVDILREDGEVHLLKAMTEIESTVATQVDAVASDTRLLFIDGTTVKVFDGTTVNTVTGVPSNPTILAYTGGLFLIGHQTGIAQLNASSGTAASALWTGFSSAVKPFWAKQRIFATMGQKIFELTLAGGAMPGSHLYEHPDPNWSWDSVAETGGAVWIAGHSGDKSAIHVITIEPDGSTPALTGATVGVQLPDGEIVNEILGYLDFLLVATNRGLRIAFVQEARAALGPLIFDGEAFSLAARGDYVWAGLAAGLTRKVDLGRTLGGDLIFAYANDLETGEGSGALRALTWFDGKLTVAQSANGIWTEGDDLVTSGFVSTGFIRYGVLEPKYFESVRVTGVVSDDTSIELSTTVHEELTHVTSLSNFSGSKDVAVNLAASGKADRLSLTFTLHRSELDPTQGPSLHGYQLRALPTPARRQRLIRVPVSIFDRESDRYGVPQGGPGFAWARLHQLEQLEEKGIPQLMQEFRTGDARMVVVEQVQFRGNRSPSRDMPNFGGRALITLRSVD